MLGADEAARRVADRAIRGQIAFYASTPAYRPVLETHGWGELAERLNGLSRRQAWAEMAAEIDDEVLNTFAVAGDAATVVRGLRDRFGDVVDRISLYTPYTTDPADLAAVREGLRG